MSKKPQPQPRMELQVADKIGSKALNTVRDALKVTISGVKVVLKAPFD